VGDLEGHFDPMSKKEGFFERVDIAFLSQHAARSAERATAPFGLPFGAVLWQ